VHAVATAADKHAAAATAYTVNRRPGVRTSGRLPALFA